jgi:hypothetical protein
VILVVHFDEQQDLAGFLPFFLSPAVMVRKGFLVVHGVLFHVTPVR